jgi:antitoxin component YwqK of YwqJK toxin-antitoxin module
MRFYSLFTSTFILLLLLTLAHREVYAQQEEKKIEENENKDVLSVEPGMEVPLTVNLDEEEEEEEEEHKKKRKKKVFYGIKTKKGYTKTGFGDDAVIETFFYLKQYEQPDPFVPEIYWYDFRRKRIRTTPNVKEDQAAILHGTYKKLTADGTVLVEGIFYKGTKHGRWMYYNKNDILVGKEKYSRGWLRESQMTYYDPNTRKNLQEVIPVDYGEKEGKYFYYHKSGRVAVEGTYQNDAKIGYWIEYYDFQGRRKKEIKYPDDPFDEKTAPYISKEWNPQGDLVYEYKPK